MFREQSQSRGEQTAFLNEMVDGQKVVQAFGYEPRAEARFGALNEVLRRASLRATFFSSLTNPVTRFVTSVVYACVGLAGAMSAVAGAITVGGLTVFLSYANQYAKPFNEISGVVTELQNAVACAGRVFALMDEPEQIPDVPDAETLTDVTGRVALEHVAFRYVPQTPLLEDVNLDVRPGERVAIVGPTGCGKTTLINLLMRFYDVNGGAITVDGHDVRSVTRDSLRQNFGMVLQDTWLKTGTVRENIALARPDATEAEIEAAAKLRMPTASSRACRRAMIRPDRHQCGPLRRAAAAALHRAAHAGAAADADFGRGDQLHRHAHRAEDPAGVR